ncbi:hypothetical protein FOCC_FOCC015248 [Frankliniella occidentalis]|nr:hypothetical protein FOCC_FOCC015248 [Frankliniella occidentalis]
MIEQLEDLPDVQKQAILACLKAAKKKGAKGNRYPLEWIYEAMLMRIKSPRLYEHIRKRKILPLPCRSLLNRYMKKIHPVFGFQTVLFQVLKEKVKDWDEKEKHGSILIDEIKIPEGIDFNRHNLKAEGVVDLEKHTPKEQRGQMGDHILEIMFQPFRGQWVQSLGCFLTKGNASGEVLAKVVLEAVSLTEETTLKVDAIVTDAATWNRNMFKKFGIDAESSSCQHPVDENRKLWFISDFCHLVKCARNCLCPIIPTKFLSNSVRAGMEFYRTKRAAIGLEDSEPTEKFIDRFNRMVDAMNSSTPLDALRKGNKHWEAIEEYLEYHKECIKLAKADGKKAFFSESTDLGLIITLRAVLEISSYLIDEVGFKYVMTARFNQDAIEQFFGIVRSFCGPDSHPTPMKFAQIHRLLSIYSLVQPPPGSNVSGVKNVQTLLTAEDLIGQSEAERKEKINEILDEVVTNGEALEALPLAHQLDHSYQPQAKEMDSQIVTFMAGFTSFRKQKVAGGCTDCILTFTQFREEAGPDHDFTKTKEIYDGYTYASDEMVRLIKAAEKAVQESTHNHDIHEDMFITTLKYLKIEPGSMVGCINHMEEVTKKIVMFYLTMRMFFIAERKNKESEKARLLKKEYTKAAKLT